MEYFALGSSPAKIGSEFQTETVPTRLVCLRHRPLTGFACASTIRFGGAKFLRLLRRCLGERRRALRHRHGSDLFERLGRNSDASLDRGGVSLVGFGNSFIHSASGMLVHASGDEACKFQWMRVPGMNTEPPTYRHNKPRFCRRFLGITDWPRLPHRL